VNAEQPLLRAINISKRYEGPVGGQPVAVLTDVSLQLSHGESVAIVGPSGSGKSTLLNILGTLDEPTTGEVWCDDKRIDNLGPKQSAAFRRDRLGFIFQMHHLMPQCTAIENVLIPTLAKEGRGRAMYQRAEELLKSVGLGDRLHHMPGQLSGGECQRVAVVRALINEPAVILADEPTGSLDANAAGDVWSILSNLSRDRGVATIAVTHARHLAERMDRVLELHTGSLTVQGAAS